MERLAIPSQLLEEHLNLGRHKAVSYLPIKTVEKVAGLSVQAYVSMIERAGRQAIVLGIDECCILSGAVYAYSSKDLMEILANSEPLLRAHGWSTDPERFIRKLAGGWLDTGNAILPVVRKAFGDG
jgi:hypothetical protein